MEWISHLDAAVMVCDTQFTITYLNEKAIAQYADAGGAGLIGQNLMDCHHEASREKLRQILATGEKNVYTIEKKGIKKLIYQSPWFVDGVIQGIVEFSMVIPMEMPHFVRV